MKRSLLLAAACSILVPAVAVAGPSSGKAERFICQLKPTKGSQVHGFVKFIKRKNSVTVRAHVEGLTPGKHGFHIHECGDCSAPDASSAKGHFNPAHHSHGGPSADERHEGDLGNLNANDKGVADYERTDRVLRMEGSGNILGKAVIVHEKVDDYKTQPTGNAGSRVACGVIVKKADFEKEK